MGLLDRISTPSPRTESRVNGGIALVSLALFAPGMTIWRHSVPFLIAVSLWTNFRTDMGVWVGSRLKARQEEQERHR